MELRARLVVEGFLQGMHRSPYHGFSVEFAEYRQYMPGDAPRYVDWKVYGKTDRYYVKMFEEETNLKGMLLLDKSASMGFAGAGISKLRWGSLLAAALGFLLIKQQDAAGLVLFDDAVRAYLPPRSVRGQLYQMLGELERVQPSERTRVSTALHLMADRLRARSGAPQASMVITLAQPAVRTTATATILIILILLSPNDLPTLPALGGRVLC